MRKIVYHVATTIDGFIAHEDGSADGFLGEGDHLPDYMESLQHYDTVIMGKNTYTFGYDFGLQPGQPAYAHMMHYIFSKTLEFDKQHEQVQVVKDDQLDLVRSLKAAEGTAIYLCGGGAFAGFLLEHELIDELILKLNPITFGGGIPMFGNTNRKLNLTLQSSKTYESGVLLLTYSINY